MKNNFEEKKAAKLERLQELAQKNESLSNNLFNQADKMASVIPMGQPILIGHHSEQRDRNYRAKIDNKMHQAVEADKKADYYKERAESLLNNTAISSDDPNAIDKLTEKLTNLQDKQELYKKINKIAFNKKLTELQKLELLQNELGLKEATAIKLLDNQSFGGIGIPSFSLTNNNAKINSTRKRIEYLQKLESIESSETIINGIKLCINAEANRVQVIFPNIPDEAIRSKLKHSGFRWSPSEGAWQRFISNSAIWSAKNILNTLNQ